MTMCTGISNVMKSDVLAGLGQTDQNNNIVTNLTSYCQSVQLQYSHLAKTYWLNINTTTSSININDDTHKYMNISEYFKLNFQYSYNTSLSIPNNELFLI